MRINKLMIVLCSTALLVTGCKGSEEEKTSKEESNVSYQNKEETTKQEKQEQKEKDQLQIEKQEQVSAKLEG